MEKNIAHNPHDNTMALVSMILGLISMLGFGLLTGIPAIILGAMALKNKQGERGFSITGIVTGAISTFFSLLFIIFLIIIFIVAAANPAPTNNDSVTPRDNTFQHSLRET